MARGHRRMTHSGLWRRGFICSASAINIFHLNDSRSVHDVSQQTPCNDVLSCHASDFLDQLVLMLFNHTGTYQDDLQPE